ncbi:MAG: hypothetical protein IT198_16195 [Acidimicrobiia bacterium]|nr:hypothetical protein [Acidimicrobiia bacterium]
MRHSMFRGLAFFRWIAWVWMAVVLAVNHTSLVRPGVAWVLVACAGVVNAWTTVDVRRRPDGVTSWPALGAEVGVALSLIVFDGVVFPPGHAFGGSQSLNGIWPLAAVFDMGLTLGFLGGVAAGVLVTGAHLGAVVLNGAELTPIRLFAVFGSGVGAGVAGVMAAYISKLLVDAEQRVTAVKAREEVARTLHDGVLQTLAVVERRSDDPDLVRLARDQERGLRVYLAGLEHRHDLEAELRRAAARFETAFGGEAVVSVPDDLPVLGDDRTAALAAAVWEALVNAGKHGAAEHVTVFAEPNDGGVFCSVRDDGSGFDPSTVVEGVGLPSSIRGRLADLGGTVEVDSSPDSGAEVRMWLGAPVRRGR